MWKRLIRTRVFRFLSSLRLAVVVLSLYTLFMAIGTIVESKTNAQYAKLSVYMTPWFIIIQIGLFLNILFAALVRFPYKKRLFGFYIIHAGLLLLMTGAGITALYGIDGSIRLLPQKPTNFVVENKPTLYAFYQSSPMRPPSEFMQALPQSASIMESNKVFMSVMDYDITVLKFIPFAEPTSEWVDSPPSKESLTLKIELQNPNFGNQLLTLSTHDKEKLTQKIGGLTVRLAPEMNLKCLQNKFLSADTKAQYLFAMKDQCLAINLDETPLHKNGYRIERLQDSSLLKIQVTTPDKQALVFYPTMNARPIKEDMTLDTDSQATLYDISGLFDGTAQLIFGKFFGESLSMAWGKGQDWHYQDSASTNEIYTLPWMSLKLSIEEILKNKELKTDWNFLPPHDKEERHFAAYIRVQNQIKPEDTRDLWIDDTEAKTVFTDRGAVIELMVGNTITELDFDLTLTEFKMNTNPGTMDPASYESFVDISSRDSKNPSQEKAHIYMNSPLKKGGFTFYQSSYFDTEDGQKGSVLSVNRDPGRALKYIGSFLLVMGSLIHFYWIKRPKKD